MSIAEPTDKTVNSPTASSGRLSHLMYQIRLYSGLILFVYVFFHLLTHAIGLVSLSNLIDAGEAAKSFIRIPIVTYILYGALAAHVVASLLKIYQRRTLNLPAREWLQIILGLAIPFLLLSHVMGTRYAVEFYGIDDGYVYVLVSATILSPLKGWMDAAGLLAAWIHSCIGLHMWFQTKSWYTERWRNWGLVIGTLVPSAALAGFLAAAKEIWPLWMDGEWRETYYEILQVQNDEIWDLLLADIDKAWYLLVAVLILLIAARGIRYLRSLTNSSVAVNYVDGPDIQHRHGATLLEISRQSNVPHAAVCGGKGRCSTCRVKIVKASPDLPQPSDQERRVLSRVKAPSDVRLACQLVPEGQLEVMLLLPADATLATPSELQPWSTGQEKTVAVLFADLRDFTKTSESKLPFDVVYLINQFSRAMGRAVEDNNGHVDKFLGDGLMAIFGVDEPAHISARNALDAAAEMIAQLDALNSRLGSDLDEPLKMGIGIHSGSVILGNMGYGNASGLTAIGDTVNAASRLEAATKQEKCTLCVSADLVKIAGIDAPEIPKKTVSIRGRSAKMDIYTIDHPNKLTEENEPMTT